jgi:hypothetical protein
MLSVRGVKVETINELIATGFVTATIERVGHGAAEITRVKITDTGRRALQSPLPHPTQPGPAHGPNDG